LGIKEMTRSNTVRLQENPAVSTTTHQCDQTDMNSSMQNKRMHHLDLARGLAITFVFFCHLAQVASYPYPFSSVQVWGQFGVQFFFVISAATMYLTFNPNKTARETWWPFLLRRTTRIFPLYIVGIFIYLCAAIIEQNIFGTESNLESYTPLNLIANILLLNNLIETAQNNVVPGGWSISAEFIFYLMFPFAMSSINSSPRNALLVVSALISLNFALQSTIPNTNHHFLYYHVFNQLPVFLLSLIYMRYLTKTSLLSSFQSLVMLPFVIYLLYLAYMIFDVSTAQGRSIPPLLCAVSFVVFLQFLQNTKSTSKVMEWLGQRSYSIYITHFLCIAQITPLAMKVFGVDSDSYVQISAFSISVTLLASIATNKFIEIPATQLLRRLQSQHAIKKCQDCE
jgi:peptidoglycan/LPS O-acetylase OafA/YrhL